MSKKIVSNITPPLVNSVPMNIPKKEIIPSNISNAINRWVPLLLSATAIGVTIIALKEIKNVRKELVNFKKESFENNPSDPNIIKKMEMMDEQIRKISKYISVMESSKNIPSTYNNQQNNQNNTKNKNVVFNKVINKEDHVNNIKEETVKETVKEEYDNNMNNNNTSHTQHNPPEDDPEEEYEYEEVTDDEED